MGLRVPGYALVAVCLLVAAGCGQPPASGEADRPLPLAPTSDQVVRGVSTPDLAAPAQPGLPAKDAECPRLDSALAALRVEEDPSAAATRMNIPVDQGRVLVLITHGEGDIDLLSAYGVEITGQRGDELQAFVPFDQLCALANDPDVLFVAAPAIAVPQ